VKKRVQDWGPQAYQQRIAAAVKKFADDSHAWLKVVHVTSLADAAATWRTVRSGQVALDVGYIISAQ
jgi:hypothetical protein